VQRNAPECYNGVVGCRLPEVPWYNGAVHVTQRDVTNPETHRRDVTEQFLHPVPTYYNHAGVFSHYVF